MQTGAKIGNGGTGVVELDGCTVVGGALVQATTITGPSAGRTTNFNLASALLSLGTLSEWAGTIVATGANTFVVTGTTTLARDSAPTLSCVTSANVALTVVAQNARFSVLTCTILVARQVTISGNGAAVLTLPTLTVAGTLQLGAGLTLNSGTSITGTGLTRLTGVTVRAPWSIGTTSIQGPLVGATTTFNMTAASSGFAVLTAWAGTVSVLGPAANTLTVTQAVMSAQSAALTSNGASVTLASTSTLRGFITASAPSTMTISGTVAAATGLVMDAPLTTLSVAGTITVQGTLDVLRNVNVLASATFGNLGLGNVTLSGCNVFGGAAFTSTGIRGPALGATTNFTLNTAGLAFAVFTAWQGILVQLMGFPYSLLIWPFLVRRRHSLCERPSRLWCHLLKRPDYRCQRRAVQQRTFRDRFQRQYRGSVDLDQRCHVHALGTCQHR